MLRFSVCSKEKMLEPFNTDFSPSSGPGCAAPESLSITGSRSARPLSHSTFSRYFQIFRAL